MISLKSVGIIKQFENGEFGMGWTTEMITKFDLIKLQNNPANIQQDHLTICGFFQTEEDFANHAERLTANLIIPTT